LKGNKADSRNKGGGLDRKTAIYVRVSPHGQKQKGDHERQKKSLLEPAAAQPP